MYFQIIIKAEYFRHVLLILQDFLNQIDYDRTRFLRHMSERDLHEISPYVALCFEIAWCMAVQDPPMYLLFKVAPPTSPLETCFEFHRLFSSAISNFQNSRKCNLPKNACMWYGAHVVVHKSNDLAYFQSPSPAISIGDIRTHMSRFL